MTEDRLNNKTPWQDLTIGGDIYEAGNAKEFKTGDWRSITPVYKPEVIEGNMKALEMALQDVHKVQ